MFVLKSNEEHIYNGNNVIAVKLQNKTVFAGDHTITEYNTGSFEIWVLRSPACYMVTELGNFNLRENDVLIFSSEDNKHVVHVDRNSIFTVLQIDPYAYCDLAPKSALFEEFAFFSSHSKGFIPKLSANTHIAKQIFSDITAAEHYFNDKSIGYELAVINHVNSIILSIVRDTGYFNSSPVANKNNVSKQHRSLKRAIDFIDSHLNEELTLEKISEASGLSPNYLSNIFRAQTGAKLWDYISEKRIMLATRLLIENPDDSIISIALRCGFNNCPNFNRTFKKYTGQTPKKYKTSMLKQDVI